MANALKPPSTTATVPVTKLLASLMRYWMFHTVPLLTETFERSLANHIITTLSICTIFVCQQSRFCSVRKNPGAMAFTRMPSPNFVATSLAMNAVKLEIPAFAAA